MDERDRKAMHQGLHIRARFKEGISDPDLDAMVKDILRTTPMTRPEAIKEAQRRIKQRSTKRWEYKLIKQPSNVTLQEVEMLLNSYGNEGWLLSGIDYGAFILTRPLPASK